MKVFLTIACGLAILLTGGCALMITNEVPHIGLPLAAIAALNTLMFAAMYGASKNRTPFYILGVADIVLALVAGVFAIAFVNDPIAQGAAPLIIGIAAFILAKGIFSFKYASTL
jgi:predicted neutral ceramidase superfamily lipid hydrolase